MATSHQVCVCSSSLQVGRKSIILIGTALLFFAGLAVAILLHLEPLSAAEQYVIVALICLCAFGFDLAWLYVSICYSYCA
jgi:hypothetical protein